MAKNNDSPEVTKALMGTGDGVTEGYDVHNPLGHPELASEKLEMSGVRDAAAQALDYFGQVLQSWGGGRIQEAIELQERASGMAQALDRVAPLKGNEFWSNYLQDRALLIKEEKAKAS